MADERISATTVIDVAPEVVFAVLAAPANHAAIDGTGRVREALDSQELHEIGQTFRVAMYHENHPDGDYRMVNRVQELQPPKVISWTPGYEADDGSLRFGGWIWRYDLDPAGPSQTRVTLTYDWSAVPDDLREHIGFPPFPADHLADSLAHLAQLSTS